MGRIIDGNGRRTSGRRPSSSMSGCITIAPPTPSVPAMTPAKVQAIGIWTTCAVCHSTSPSQKT
eukprot:COSAG01_NODE_5197_length_4417_cov_5.847383_5_plen_64_part_00